MGGSFSVVTSIWGLGSFGHHHHHHIYFRLPERPHALHNSASDQYG